MSTFIPTIQHTSSQCNKPKKGTKRKKEKKKELKGIQIRK